MSVPARNVLHMNPNVSEKAATAALGDDWDQWQSLLRNAIVAFARYCRTLTTPRRYSALIESKRIEGTRRALSLAVHLRRSSPARISPRLPLVETLAAASNAPGRAA